MGNHIPLNYCKNLRVEQYNYQRTVQYLYKTMNKHTLAVSHHTPEKHTCNDTYIHALVSRSIAIYPRTNSISAVSIISRIRRRKTGLGGSVSHTK
jgi:hypothetical protein